MSKKAPSKKVTKKEVKKVIEHEVVETPDPKVVQAARNKYRNSAKFPKARTAGR